MFNISKDTLSKIVPHFRDSVLFAALATVALGVAELSFTGSSHIANFVFGALAVVVCAGLTALAAANVALIVGEVRE